MKRIRHAVFAASCLASCVALPLAPLPVFAQTAAMLPADAPPDAVVKEAVGGVIAAAARTSDAAEVERLVDRQFIPYTDFERMTRLAVGSAWREATPEQQTQLVTQFRMLFVRTYAASLAEIREQGVHFEYKPFAAKPGARDVVVRTQAVSGADVNEIDYRLLSTPAGWRIYDINMMGAWLIQVYRKQFGEQIAQGGVDGLLKFLTAHNRRAAGG